MNRELPNSNDIERSLIVYTLMCGNPPEVLDLCDMASESLFFNPVNFSVFKQLKNLAVKHKGKISQKLLESNLLQHEGINPKVLDEIICESPVCSDPEADILKLQELSVKRRIIIESKEVIYKAYSAEDGLKILDEYQQSINSIDPGNADSGFVHVSDVVKNVLSDMEDKIKNGIKNTGYKTGWPKLDLLLGGIEKGDLIVIGGRPSMGKTAFSLNLARRLSFYNNNMPGGFFSLETTNLKLAYRLLSSEGGFNSRKFNSASFEKKGEMTTLDDAIYNISQLPLYFDDTGGLSPESLKRRARYAVKKLGLKFIVIDYVQIMDLKGKRYEAVSEASRTLQQLGHELKIPVIALAQLNRNLENRENKRPRSSDLKESGQLEQDADKIIFLFREAKYQDESKLHDIEKGFVEVNVEKNRDGETGIVPFHFDMKTATFFEKTNQY